MIITTANLSKRYNREWIFRNVSERFDRESPYIITGPNGSGKSTLLQVLWGQLPPSTGDIIYQIDEQNIPVEEVYKHVAIATPYMDLIDEFTLTEQLSFHFTMRAPRAGLRLPEIMDRMYLTAAADKQILNFSSGMRQRLKLGLAFFTQANALFLDEPGTNLDATALAWYNERVAELSSSVTMFIASNDPREFPEKHRMLKMTAFKASDSQR